MKGINFRGFSHIILAGAMGWLAGCSVGPNYSRPSVTVPETYANETNGWKVAEPQAEIAKGKWWQIFGDADLNNLEEAAATNNQRLIAVAAVFREARASVNVSRSGYFPHLGLVPTVGRERDSANRPVNGISPGAGDTYNVFSVPFDASYEIDLWGSVRRTVEAAKANEQANAADLENARLSLQAEIAGDYFTMRALDSELDLLVSNVYVFQKSLDLTKNRRAGGVSTDLDVAQAETILKTTEAQLPATQLSRARYEHALAALSGQPASNFHLTVKPIGTLPPILPSGVPSALLERRPDISAAERRMAAANANVGVAKAAFYPSVQLNGLAGFESVTAGSLFNWSSRFWSVGPQLNLPLFEGGLLRANLRLNQAAYDQVVALYRQSVLSAFAEVEDNLSAQKLLAIENDAQDAALQSARRTLDIANNRYKAGLVTYLEVATAQNSALEQERISVRLRGDQLVTTVALIKSLGGGWQ